MKKFLMIVLSIGIVLVLGMGIYWQISEKEIETKMSSEISDSNDFSNQSEKRMVLSLEDQIGENTVWCGTFNLIWNDLKNDLAKQDIVFTPQPPIVENLNKGTFNTSYLDENSYYKVYGKPSLALKEEIEKSIKEKFNETSDILDDFDWENATPEDYFLYSMLKKEFEFPKEFTELEKGKFGKYENVSYFGINGATEDVVREQVSVLYYEDEDSFAVKLKTKNDDEVILAKGTKENSFGEIYEQIKQKSKKYEGANELAEEEILQIPNLKIDLKEEIKEVENQPFSFADGKQYLIRQALQTIEFDLDKKGGKIKSEAGMMVQRLTAMLPADPRKFLMDDTFTIFLVEKEQDLPYFAAQISDITQVQSQAKLAENAENPEEKVSFYGTIIKANPNSILVEPREGEAIRNSADKISIDLGEGNDYMYEIGTNVKVTYNGIILETYPAQIKAIDIEIKSAENFELRFEDESYESQAKVRPILEKTETEKYDYNIYAYMGEVNIVIDDEEMPLREALQQNKITMDEILAKANRELDEEKIQGDTYKDGGSIEYRYENYTMIKVHNLDGNRDVYIGVPEMTLNELEIEKRGV